jgi:D-aspartate ligase
VRFEEFIERARRVTPAIALQASLANGLGIIRDLGRESVPMLALDANPRALGFRSRYAAGRVIVDPKLDEEEFVSSMLEIGRQLPRRAVVFPTHDEYVWAVSRHAERLEPYFIIPFSRWDVMEAVADKEEQLEAASRAGIDTPRTAFVRSPADLEAAADEIGFPSIFKPADALAFKERFGRQVLEIPSADALREAYERVRDCGTLLLQEIVPGGDEELYTLGSYLDAESRPLAVFTGRKLRQHPRRFGSCNVAESVWLAHVADAGLRLLRELHYHGVSQVEFKRDPRDGRFRLIEINARHWLWHSLATVCGVNISYAAYRDVTGAPFFARAQDEGPRWVLTLRDTYDSALDIWRGELTAGEWLSSLRGRRVDGLLSFRDPIPGVLNAGRMGQLAVRRALERRQRV